MYEFQERDIVRIGARCADTWARGRKARVMKRIKKGYYEVLVDFNTERARLLPFINALYLELIQAPPERGNVAPLRRMKLRVIAGDRKD
jgi:hypothetical protein